MTDIIAPVSSVKAIEFPSTELSQVLNRVSGVAARFTDLLLVALGLLALSGHIVDLCPGLPHLQQVMTEVLCWLLLLLLCRCWLRRAGVFLPLACPAVDGFVSKLPASRKCCHMQHPRLLHHRGSVFTGKPVKSLKCIPRKM